MIYAGDEHYGDAQTAPELETNPLALADPCDECGADAGEPCRPFCTADPTADM